MPTRSNESWTTEEEAFLCQLFNQQITLSDIAEELGRSELAIVARLSKMKIRPAITTDNVEIHHARRRASVSNLQTARDENQRNIQTPEQLVDVQQAFHNFHFVYGIINPRKST